MDGEPTLSLAMAEALALAEQAAAAGEVPVGAVILDRDGGVIARAHNRVEVDCDPTGHAEMLAIRAAAAVLGDARLDGCTLVVTLEPCAMCAGAIAHARIGRLVFAAYDPKGGGVEHGARLFERPTCHHRPDVIGGLEESKAARLLRDFFQQLR
ncbi:MAG: nucleoside deaminase [Rhodospirillales bacterium]